MGFPHYKSKKTFAEILYNEYGKWEYLSAGQVPETAKDAAGKNKTPPYDPGGWKLKSVTVSREPSGKYFASLLFDCENQTAEKRQAEKFLGMDFAMHGMCVFSTGERAGYPMFYRNAEKKACPGTEKTFQM